MILVDVNGGGRQGMSPQALAIESGCEWITLDRDYRQFPGLRWRAPG